MPAQFALRVAILSGFALVMFSIIFFRLWYLQVLSGDKYLKQAKNNQVREVTVQAPRGEILDRNGHVLVDNRTALALQLQPTELPRSHRKRKQEFARLGPGDRHVARRDPQAAPQADQGPAGEPGDAEARRRLRPRLLPAREPGPVPRGQRPAGLRPQLPERHRWRRRSSATSARSPSEQLKEPRYQGAAARRPGRPVGGREHVRQRPAGNQRHDPGPGRRRRASPTGGVLSQTQPQAGRQPAADASTAACRRRARRRSTRFSTPGAFVAMNVEERRDPRASAPRPPTTPRSSPSR